MKNCKVKHIKNAIILYKDKNVNNVSFNSGTQILTLYLDNKENQSEVLEIDLSEMKLNAFKSMILQNFLNNG